MNLTKPQLKSLIREVISQVTEASKGNYTQALRKVKALIDQSPVKASLKALIKNYNSEPMLELRAYGLPMGNSHGAVELQDEFADLVEKIRKDGWEVVEIDESQASGKQFKYALFTFKDSYDPRQDRDSIFGPHGPASNY